MAFLVQQDYLKGKTTLLRFAKYSDFGTRAQHAVLLQSENTGHVIIMCETQTQ